MDINGIGPSSGPPQGVDPNQYAMQYAKQNGISLEEAKQQLKAKFGDPNNRQVGTPQAIPKNDNSISGALSTGNVDKQRGKNSLPPEAVKLRTLGIPLNVIMQGDNAIKKYADEHNIRLPEKKKIDQDT